MHIEGRAHKYGDNVDTDVIIPARYLNISDKKELAAHAMEDLDGEFVKKVKAGELMLAGENFGCGSSREHAPMVLKECGIACIIARSFARIFYRNAINIGLPIIECGQAAAEAEAGHIISVDFEKGVIVNKTLNKKYSFEPMPDFIKNIMESGGLIECIREGKL
ncbi:MAG: 3-isopropylmalate dehydratase small subunit [Christensenellaceae bacterium]|nr:3-isopropylmalate dehydratase small subunit [Christensenellaceae bacterium]MBS6563865.1 3-isopropylmalate dehydratase small subunit [Clostridiales bacterium]